MGCCSIHSHGDQQQPYLPFYCKQLLLYIDSRQKDKIWCLQALKLDLAACTIMAAGNDYLPPVRGLAPAKSGLERLWSCYQAVRATKRYSAR